MKIVSNPSPNFFTGRYGYNSEIIVVHIMAGSLSATDNWFADTNSQVSSHYGVGENGEVHQYVDEANSAWTNGIVNQPTSKVVKSRLGVNPNYYSLTIENEGYDMNEASEIHLSTLVDLIRSLADKYKIPLDRDHILGHQEIDGIKKPNCPSHDRTFMDRLVAQAKGQAIPYVFNTPLVYGQRHPDVKAIQFILKKERLFPNDPIDDLYGDNTASGLYKFQVKYKVAPKAELDSLMGKTFGPKTRVAMNNLKVVIT